jgi:hypothetical protein
LEPACLDDRRDRWLAAGIPSEQIDAGVQSTALPYAFGIGPDDAFGIHALGTRVALHASIEGWVESLSVARHASSQAASITILRGGQVDDLDLTGFEEVRAVQGVADRWWRGIDSLIAVYRGESRLFARASAVAYIYAGLDEWDLGTHLWAVPTGWQLEGSAQALVGWDVNGVLIERRRQGIYESWFEHLDGRNFCTDPPGPVIHRALRTGPGRTSPRGLDRPVRDHVSGLLVVAVAQWDDGERQALPGRAGFGGDRADQAARSGTPGDPLGQGGLDVAGGVADGHQDVVRVVLGLRRLGLLLGLVLGLGHDALSRHGLPR